MKKLRKRGNINNIYNLIKIKEVKVLNESLIMESIIWSALWAFFVIISVRIFPFTIAHDYPEEVRNIANIQKPSSKQKLQGLLLGIIGLSIMFGLLIVFSLTHFNKQNLSFLNIFKYLWLICMTWNVIDLLIIDWLMICTFSVKLFVLPNTENCKGNRDYRFHFIGFLKGCITMTLTAFIFSGISYGIIYFLR